MAPEPQATFVSYSRDDSDFALRLTEDLKSAGATVWLDQLDINPGQRWARAVQDALAASPRILVILSPSSVESTNVDDEISFALEELKTVIPVLYRDCKIPFRLRPYQYVDFRTNYARGLRILLNNLGVSRIVEHPPQQPPPPPIVEPTHRQPEASKPIREQAAPEPKPEAKPEAKPKPIRKPKPEQSPVPPPIYETPNPTQPQAPPIHIEAKPIPTIPLATLTSLPLEESLLPATTFQRWAPCVAMLLLTFLSYFARNLLSLLFSPIFSFGELTTTQLSTILLGFTILYMLTSPVWGLWMDRTGLWLPTLSAIVIWSIALAAHGLFPSPTGLFFAHSILGIGIAATFPAAFKTALDTLPATRRAIGIAIAYSGGPLATIFAPAIFMPIAIHFSFRFAFLFAALLSVIWIILWLTLRATLSQSHSSPLQTGTSRWSRNFFANVAVYAFGAIPITFVLFFLPRIANARLENRSLIFLFVSVALIAGYLFFGKLADHRQPQGTRPGRLFFILAIAGVILIPIEITVLRTYRLDFVLPTLAFQMFLGAGFIIMSLSDGMTTLPKQHAAFFAGVCTFAWTLISTIATPFITQVLSPVNQSMSILIAGVLPLLGTILWKILSTTPTPQPSTLPTQKAST